jgi:hypothetical protein
MRDLYRKCSVIGENKTIASIRTHPEMNSTGIYLLYVYLHPNKNIDQHASMALGIAIPMTTHLLETGSVDRKFNEELSRASLAAFDEYISIH